MSKVQLVKAVAVISAMFCALSAHAIERQVAVKRPVISPPVQRPLATPPLVVPPGTTPPATPVVTVTTCASKQASRC